MKSFFSFIFSFSFMAPASAGLFGRIGHVFDETETCEARLIPFTVERGELGGYTPCDFDYVLLGQTPNPRTKAMRMIHASFKRGSNEHNRGVCGGNDLPPPQNLDALEKWMKNGDINVDDVFLSSCMDPKTREGLLGYNGDFSAFYGARIYRCYDINSRDDDRGGRNGLVEGAVAMGVPADPICYAGTVIKELPCPGNPWENENHRTMCTQAQQPTVKLCVTPVPTGDENGPPSTGVLQAQVLAQQVLDRAGSGLQSRGATYIPNSLSGNGNGDSSPLATVPPISIPQLGTSSNASGSSTSGGNNQSGGSPSANANGALVGGNPNAANNSAAVQSAINYLDDQTGYASAGGAGGAANGLGRGRARGAGGGITSSGGHDKDGKNANLVFDDASSGAASRGIGATDGPMLSPDPFDYFTRIALDKSIFKVVEDRYRGETVTQILRGK